MNHQSLKAETSREASEFRDLMAPLAPYLSEEDHKWLDMAIRQLEDQQLCIAVMGEIKVGKSTLINALLGRTVLVSDVVECTAAPTYVLSAAGHPDAAPDSVRVTWTNQQVEWETLENLPAVTTLMAGHPHMKVDRVELFIDGDIPPPTMTIVDTPGLNGRPELGTRTLRQMALAHVAVVVLALDRGIGTQLDVDAIAQVHKVASRVLIVINKGDCAAGEESARRVRQELVEKMDDCGVKLDPGLVFVVSAKMQMEGSYSGSWGEALRCGFDGFLEALVEQLDEDWRVETLRKQPRVVLAGIARRLGEELSQELATLEQGETADLEAERAALQTQEQRLDEALENVLGQAREDVAFEVQALTLFLQRSQRDLEGAARSRIEALSDEELQGGNQAVVKLGNWLKSVLKQHAHQRVKAVFEAISRRLFRELEAQVQGQLRLKLPGLNPIRFDASSIDQRVKARYSEQLGAAKDEVESAVRKHANLKRDLEQERLRLTSLRASLQELEQLRRALEHARQKREALGARPKPEVKYREVEKTRTVSRSGLFGRIRDWWSGKQTETYRENEPYTDDTRVKRWEQAFQPLDLAVQELEKKVQAGAATEREARRIEGQVSQLAAAVAVAAKRVDQAKLAKAQADEEYRQAGHRERRATLLHNILSEIDRAICTLRDDLRPDFERLLGDIEREFRTQFASQAKAYREGLNRAAAERLEMHKEHSQRHRECRAALHVAETIVARYSATQHA
jgi:uncharacterized protein YjbJ (UPF0337 family)